MPQNIKRHLFQEFKAKYQTSKWKLFCNFIFILLWLSPSLLRIFIGFWFCISMVVRNLKSGILDWILRPSRVNHKSREFCAFLMLRYFSGDLVFAGIGGFIGHYSYGNSEWIKKAEVYSPEGNCNIRLPDLPIVLHYPVKIRVRG